ncbi:hypothetical protein [Rhodococcus koreensis]
MDTGVHPGSCALVPGRRRLAHGYAWHTIAGYRFGEVVNTDPVVIARSGGDRHPIPWPVGSSSWIEGSVFSLGTADLAARR